MAAQKHRHPSVAYQSASVIHGRSKEPLFGETSMNRIAVALASGCILLSAASAGAQDKPDMSHVDAVTAYVTEHVKPWLSDPALIEAINAATEKHNRLNYDEIRQLDQDWKDKKPIVEETMNNDTSAMLKEKMAETPAITEIFVMDAQGFNVGQTGETSDYYQADEAKWQKTYPVGVPTRSSSTWPRKTAARRSRRRASRSRISRARWSGPSRSASTSAC
jgi:hypothetical protein